MRRLCGECGGDGDTVVYADDGRPVRQTCHVCGGKGFRDFSGYDVADREPAPENYRRSA